MCNASFDSVEVCDTIVETGGILQILLGDLDAMSWERDKLDDKFFEDVTKSHVYIVANVVHLSTLSRPLLRQRRAFETLQRIRENDEIKQVSGAIIMKTA